MAAVASLPLLRNATIVKIEIVDRAISTSTTNPFPYTLTAIVLILASVFLNLIYLAINCPLDLAPDEAHYWHWSQHLSWSYYSKGPMVAWLIRASCELFGSLSIVLTGTEAWAVRLPAVGCHAALLAGWYVLASTIASSKPLGLAVVAIALTLPPVAVGAVMMTIDGPFLACWCWAMICVAKAMQADGIRWWLGAGICCFLGVVSKYPMLLFPLAISLYLLVDRSRRKKLSGFGFWIMIAMTGMGGLPLVLWNAAHDWVSLRHVLGQAGWDGAHSQQIRPFGPFGFVAGQFGILLGYWFVAYAAAGWRFRWHPDNDLSLLWWTSVPVWGLFFAASFFSAGQVNWPIAAYVSGLVLAVIWLKEHYEWASNRAKPIIRNGLIIASIFGLAISFVLHYPITAVPVASVLFGKQSNLNPTPIRKLDPTCRLRGWKTVAERLDTIRDRVRSETGREAILAGMAWTMPGELSFYCRGHPPAYSFGLALGDRHSQYELWRPNPIADAQVFLGKTFIYVGDEIPNASAVFDRVEPPIRVVHSEWDVPIAAWTVWVCHGFRGFDSREPTSVRPGY